MGGVASVTAEAKQQGNQLFKEGKYADAVAAYTRALDADQRDHSLYSNRCAARLKLGDKGFALKDALICVSLSPIWPKGYYRLGCAYGAVGRHTDAVDAYLKAYALSPADEAIKAALQQEEKAVGMLRPRGYVYTWGAHDAVGLSTGGSGRGDVITPKPVDLVKGRQVRDLSCGLTHSVVVTAAGEVLTWGQNKYGQCGVSLPGETEAILRPVFVAGLLSHKCYAVACGGGHTVVLTESGKVFSWGTGSCGQLGHGSKENLAYPRVVEALSSVMVTGVACGFGHTALVGDDGSCFAFGWNRDGQIGSGNKQDVLKPQKVKGLEGVPIQHVSCGGGHTAVVSFDGKLFTFGSGSCGQLGHGDSEDKLEASSVTGGGLGVIASVACGEEFTIAVSAARSVWGFGLNNVGQLGGASEEEMVTLPKRIKALDGQGVEFCCCTQGSVLAVTAKGLILVWGTTDNAGAAERVAAMLQSQGGGGAGGGVKGKPPTALEHMSKRTVNQMRCGRKHYLVSLRGAFGAKCTAEGRGLLNASVGKRAKFTITGRDEDGDCVGQGGDRFDVLVFTDDGDCVTDVSVDDNMDGTYACEWTPPKAGPCVAWVRLGGVHVAGSPFAVEVACGAPSLDQCTATASFSEGAFYHMAGKQAKVFVDVCDAMGNMVAEGVAVKGQGLLLPCDDDGGEALDGEDVAMAYTQLPGGRHEFSLTPQKVGAYVFSFTVDGKPIAPVDGEVVPGVADAASSSCFGDGVTQCTAGEDTEFRVRVHDRFGHLGAIVKYGYPQDYEEAEQVPLKVSVREVLKGGGGGEELSCSVQSMGMFLGKLYARGEFAVGYTPKRIGEVRVEAMVAGSHVKGSPFAVTVRGGPASAPHSYVRESDIEGSSLRDGAAERSFLLFAVDAAGNRRNTGGDAFSAKLKGPSETGGTIDVALKDNGDGTYQGVFKVSKSGRYWLEVLLGPIGPSRESVAGSPYVIDFSPDPAEEVRRRHEAQERRIQREKAAEQRRKDDDKERKARAAEEEKARESERDAARAEKEKQRLRTQGKVDERKEVEAKAAEMEKRRRLMEKLRKEEDVRRKAVALEEEKRNATLAKMQETQQKRSRPGSAMKRAGGGFAVSFDTPKTELGDGVGLG